MCSQSHESIDRINFIRLQKKLKVKTLQIVIHGHYSLHHLSQNSCHEENAPDLRTDDNRWVQDLANMQNDSIQ